MNYKLDSYIDICSRVDNSPAHRNTSPASSARTSAKCLECALIAPKHTVINVCSKSIIIFAQNVHRAPYPWVFQNFSIRK